MKKIVLYMAVIAAALPMAASAALYRCGSAYQDRPCEGGVPQEALRPSGARNVPSSTLSPGPGTSSLRERRDVVGCRQLRDLRQSAEIRSRTAGSLREVELHRQNLKGLDDRLVNEGCT